MNYKKMFLVVVAGLLVYDTCDAMIMRMLRKYKSQLPSHKNAMDIRWNNVNKRNDDKRKMRKIGFGEN